MKPRFAACFLLITLLANTGTGAELAEAYFNVETGRLCFPVYATQKGASYDACLQLAQRVPNHEFHLQSVVPATHSVANSPTFDPATGLKLPLVRLSDGRVFADATFSVTTVGSTTVFRLGGIRRIDTLYDQRNMSVARLWNEALLDSIRNDVARPTVHARNLFHVSVAMYDAWSAFANTAEPYLLGNTVDGYTCPFTVFPGFANIEANRREAISFAAYRVLRHRFARSPGVAKSRRIIDDLMLLQGYDIGNESRDYSAGSGAALGNHIADCVIGYGLVDGSNEATNYASTNYTASNPALRLSGSGNAAMLDPDHWQPLAFDEYLDALGHLYPASTPAFLTPEWGRVRPFALQAGALNIYQRGGTDWLVYHDPGPPAQMSGDRDLMKWNHSLVAIWGAHHDAGDGVMWDISPARIGNIPDYPESLSAHRDFYDLLGGGETSRGRDINPVTGQPYAPQIVPRGDYTRVLAQFWADGPRSETPPGHWYTIFNTVSDHPLMEKKFRGEGPVLSDLEWDVKGYVALGGALHDVAITVWGIKSWYDVSRPVSVIRYMAEKGQSTSPNLPNYDPEGFELVPGYIEQVAAGDPLAGANGEHVGEIKLYTWRGPLYAKPGHELAGVGWILAKDWWPFQTANFVTPPFAGYVSGHSAFSRAAAEVLSLFTGDEYFPGGMSGFVAKKDEFLVAEKGPSVDVILQWATYRDASDQTSLSRIWGGIHPPFDDIPARHIGARIGVDAFNKAALYFRNLRP